MPKLLNNQNSNIPPNLLLGGEIILAMQTLTEPIRRMNEAFESLTKPIQQMQEAMDGMFLPIKIMQNTFNTSFGPTIKMMNAIREMAEMHQRMFERIPLFGFDNTITRSAGLGIVQKWLREPQIIDGEIADEEKSPQQPLLQQAVTIPQALVPVTPSASRYQARSMMGLKEISGRSFQFKRKTLQKLSYRNCEGRLLALFLESRDLFVSDRDIYETLRIPDGRSFSWVLRNLKRKFQANGLSVVIERRWDPDGYILIDISYLQ